MIFFVAALITTIVAITVSNNWVFRYRLSQDEKQRLKSINTVFKESIPLLMQKKFSAFAFLSNTVYPDVAISFGLDNVFFNNLKKSGLISDNLIVGILDKKFAVRSLSKESSILKENISKYHMQNGITSDFNVIDNNLVLVKGIKIMDMGKDQGYLVGIIPNEWIKGLLKNNYLAKVGDYKYLSPSVDFLFSKREKSEEPDSIYLAKSGEKAVDMEKVNHFDVILIDVDLGNAKMNKFETVKVLRSQGSDAVVCVNSNRGALEYGKIALSYGAQNFLPKPMVRTHLLKIIYSAIIRKISRKRMALSYQ